MTTRKIKIYIFLVLLSWMTVPNYSSFCSMNFCAYMYRRDININSPEIKVLSFLPWDVNTYNDFGLFTLFNSGELPLVQACLAGDKEIVAMLLKKGADPNKTHDGYWHAVSATVLRYSNFADRMEILDALFTAGADISYLTGDMSPLRYIRDDMYKRESMMILGKLHQHNVSFVDTDLSYRMAMDNDVDGLRYLVDELKVDINASEHGLHPLFGAVKGASYEAAEYLLSIGTNTDVLYKNKTPLELAMESGDKKMINILTPVDT